MEGYDKGHKIIYINDNWVYADNEEKSNNFNPRPCIRCGEGGEIDHCLGRLPGITAACCGHGTGSGYLAFENGTVIRFGDIIEVSHKKGDYIESTHIDKSVKIDENLNVKFMDYEPNISYKNTFLPKPNTIVKEEDIPYHIADFRNHRLNDGFDNEKNEIIVVKENIDENKIAISFGAF